MIGARDLGRLLATPIAVLALAGPVRGQAPAPAQGDAGGPPPVAAGAAASAPAERIQFPPGSSSVSVRVEFQGSGAARPAAPGSGAPGAGGRRAGAGTGVPPGGSPAPAPAGAATVAERRFVLSARAGQTLTVGLRAPGEHPGLELALLCPGNGHTGVGRHGSLQGSALLPESGDYTILVSKIGDGPTAPAVLEVAVTGSPNRIVARPYTGTYYRQDGSGSSIDVQEVLGAARPGRTAQSAVPGAGGTAGDAGAGGTAAPAGGARAAPGAPGAAGSAGDAGAGGDAGGGGGPLLRFSIVAFQGALDSPFGPNLGIADGTVTLRDGVGLYAKDGCRLTFRFGRPGTGELHLSEAGDCGFGHNVTARGDYRRTSLCAAPDGAP
jgi:hypothetical protein